MQVLVLVVGLAVLCLCNAQSQNLPNSGLYISFSDDALSSTMELITDDLVNNINTYTGWQTISGSSSSASYTFSDWKVSIALVNPAWKDVDTDELLIGWQEFNFTIESLYHVCGTSWPNPCEDGNMYIYTTDTDTKMYLDTILNMNEDPPFINVTATDLDFRRNGIDIYVQCTNTDIADAVAENFVTLFTDAIAKSARAALSKHVTSFKTEFSFADGIGLDLESDWWILSAGTTGVNPMIFVPTLGGFYINISETVTQPPFAPQFTPSLSYLESPQQDFNIAITDSLTWTMGAIGPFQQTSEVPPQSPVQLNTNDAFFLQVVPGLSAYPKMDITMTSKFVQASTPTIDANGLHVWGTSLTLDFTLSNSSFSHHGWTLSNVFNIDFNIVASVSGNLVVFNATISNFSSIVTVTESDVGNIAGSGFSSLYQLLESQIKVPGFAIHLPDAVTALNPTVKFYPQYIGFGVDFKFNSENEKGGGEEEEQKDWIKNSVGQAIAIN